MSEEVPVFKAGDFVKHKLGFKGLVHGVKAEIRNPDGTVIQELAPHELIYLVGYMDKNGKMEMLQCNYQVLEAYVNSDSPRYVE